MLRVIGMHTASVSGSEPSCVCREANDYRTQESDLVSEWRGPTAPQRYLPANLLCEPTVLNRSAWMAPTQDVK